MAEKGENALRVCDQCGQPVPPWISLRVRDFPFLDGAFPRAIRVMNIDGLVHNRDGARAWGRLLFIETKHGSERLDKGQREALCALSAIPDATVLFVRELGLDLYAAVFVSPRWDGSLASAYMWNSQQLHEWAKGWFGVQTLYETELVYGDSLDAAILQWEREHGGQPVEA